MIRMPKARVAVGKNRELMGLNPATLDFTGLLHLIRDKLLFWASHNRTRNYANGRSISLSALLYLCLGQALWRGIRALASSRSAGRDPGRHADRPLWRPPGGSRSGHLFHCPDWRH